VNRLLKFYGDRFELSSTGEIVRLAPQGMEALVETTTPAQAGDTNVAKINNAVRIG
jgi:hypothetical protein